MKHAYKKFFSILKKLGRRYGDAIKSEIQFANNYNQRKRSIKFKKII